MRVTLLLRLAVRFLATLVVFLLAIAGAGAWYMFALPGRAYVGALPPMTTEEVSLAGRLSRHVVAIGSAPHNTFHVEALEQAASYIEGVLTGYGYSPERQIYDADGDTVRNVYVTLEPRGSAPPRRTVVVGAHYDSCGEAPGANDNATGAAAVLELARLLKGVAMADTRLILVLFVNEEPPHFETGRMGSVHFARMLAARHEPVAAMLSLETIGFFTDAPGSQRYPEPLDKVLPSKGNFISFVGMPGSRDLVHQVVGSFRASTAFPTVGGIAPGFMPGIAWSDHGSFVDEGFQALMITDTAVFRYPHYHKPTDTPDKVDTGKLARVTKGIEHAVRDLIKAPQR